MLRIPNAVTVGDCAKCMVDTNGADFVLWGHAKPGCI